MKHLLAIAITLLPSAVLAEQFTPKQLIEVMTKSPDNRNVRVHDLMRLGLDIDDDDDDDGLPPLDDDGSSKVEEVD